MGEEFVGQARLFRERAETVGVHLDVLARAGEQEIAPAAQHLEEMAGDGPNLGYGWEGHLRGTA